MDRTGVDDPEAEQNIIRDEQTDAALNPAAVQVMAQLMAMLQQQGIQPSQGAQEMAQQQAQSLADYRQLAGGQQGSPAKNASAEQPQGAPPEAAPAHTVKGSGAHRHHRPRRLRCPVVRLPPRPMVQEGEASNRIISSTPIPGP